MELVYEGKKSISDLENIINNKINNSYPIHIISEKGAYISGDNFEVMIRLLKYYENKIDLIYIDPPFNTNSTFYYKEGRVSTVSTERNSDVAYVDKFSMNSYIEFMRERLYLMHKLLSNKGTLYLHVDLKVGHYLKIVLDEIFGEENYLNDITRIKSNPKNFKRKAFGNEKDVIYVYAKNKPNNIFNDIKEPLSDDEIKQMFSKIDDKGRRYTTVPCHAPKETLNGETGREWRGMLPPKGRHWRCSPRKLELMDAEGLIEWSCNGIPRIKKYADEHTGKKIQDIWDYKDPQYPIYPTEKNHDMLDMIVKQSSNEGSIIMDCFSGSSAFIKAGVTLNRVVIGIDKSDVSFTVSKADKLLDKIDFIDGTN